jgi:hypothetical protein
MTDLLRWTAIQINRRNFVRRSAVALFGAFAGSAVWARPVHAEAPCTGPFGSGLCSPDNCSATHHCKNLCSAYASGCGTQTGCWTAPGGGICCDCVCYRPPTGSFFCYCYG